MSPQLQNILDLIKQSAQLNDADKAAIEKAIKETDKALEIANFKLDRTEKVKRTTAILLEETIAELEQKRKAVEAQNRELEIESSLERVRTVAMGMKNPDDLLSICEILFKELQALGFSELRNALIHTYVDEKNYFVDYDFSDFTGGRISRIPYNSLPFIEKYLKEIRKSKDAFTEIELGGKELEEWKDFRRTSGQTDDPRLDSALSLYYYNYSIGVGDVGISTFHPIVHEKREILKRFRNVFDLAYRRYVDIQQAEAQAREAQIEAALERVRSRSMAMHKSDELLEVVTVIFEQLKKLGLQLWNCAIIRIQSKQSYEGEIWMTRPDGKMMGHSFVIPLDKVPVYRNLYEAWKNKEEFHVEFLQDTEIVKHHNKIASLNIFPVDKMKQAAGRELPGKMFFHGINFSAGILAVITTEAVGDNTLLIRFGNTFKQTYTRFLDLQKAEAQAREAQIEAGLERVRSRTMAMHQSHELNETAALLYAELSKLGIEKLTCGFTLLEADTGMGTCYMANPEGSFTWDAFQLNHTGSPVFLSMYESWKKQEPFYQYELAGQVNVEHNRYLAETADNFPIPVEQLLAILPPVTFSNSFNFRYGYLLVVTLSSLNPEQSLIISRFAKVFEQTYTRFLDLQKAEAQARESQIQLALERVRARTMAMQRSEELAEVATVLFQQVKALGIPQWTCGFSIFEIDDKEFTWYPGGPNGEILPPTKIPLTEHPVFIQFNESRKRGDELYIYEKTGEVQADHYRYMCSLPVIGEYLQSRIDAGEKIPEFQIDHLANFSHGNLIFITYEHFPEMHDVFKRFAKVFDLTYTRFLDLQKAEAQAREAKIEAALERVRARTMAMHNSEDVSIAAATMFIELEKLGIENFRGGILNIKENKTMDVWSVNKSADSDPHDPVGRGKTIRAAGQWDMTLHPWWRELYKGWINKDEFLQYFLTGTEREDYVKILDARRDYIPGGIRQLPDCHIQAYYFGEGAIWTFSLQPHSDEDKQVMKKFASVFSLTFRRYQDLKKAEALAREATIEAALERVRARAMAMQTSEDVVSATSVLFSELDKLDIKTMRCGILIIDETQTMEVWTSVFTTDGQITRVIGSLDMRIHPLLEGIFKSWTQKEDVFRYKLIGDDIQRYYSALANAHKPYSVLLQNSNVPDHYCHVYLFEEGGLYTFSVDDHSNEVRQVLKRFTSVFSLTFRRYQDLKKSEAQAKEAIKQATLDRIRADIASMRTVADLDKITPLIWNELNILGIPFIRCGVFIMDEKQRLIHTFLSAPDGTAIAAFHLPYDTSGNLSKVLTHWKANEKYLDHWDQSAFTELANILVKQGAITSPDQYLASIPHGGFYLHFLPFLQGMLYVGSLTQLGDEEIKLLQSVADAFSTAYARYEDFNKLEAAKTQVETTLVNLKQAQQQLVQSEKMASLGELTAGIAHEIQNPLNFVNNFSDVSKELLEEMKAELATGNVQQAAEIADDVIENLEKILNHGKRADGIVKGMLQHSRTSSGQKELTDINALTDEYLRLAYHGLRAKDKSFNAKFETDFDASIGKIQVVPQEIGRVILNLINNAFYAVTEKRKENVEGYEPTVTVSTLKLNGYVEIRIKDNGIGIQKKVLDKIFQPFFTTKPTGQGTGLGLSLAYDIVTKGHGGELKVETREGEGSEFIIKL